MSDPWANKILEFCWSWDSGDSHLRKPGTTNYIKFKMIPSYVGMPDPNNWANQYTIDYVQGEQKPNWKPVIFTPIGTKEPAPPLDEPLPYYDDTIPVQKKYKKLRKYLDRYVTPHTPTTRMLEGIFLVTVDGNVAVDKLRLIYLHNAMEDGGDCYFAVFCHHVGGPVLSQNGGGGGPPTSP